jgi:hypothetical protein
MLKAQCPTCTKRSIQFRLTTDDGDLAVETKPCEACRYELTDGERAGKVKILVDAIMRKNGATKVEAFTRALALMLT